MTILSGRNHAPGDLRAASQIWAVWARRPGSRRAQCALVLGDVPNLRELWGDAALFVPPDDPNALAEAIEQSASDDAFRVAYAARGRVRALTCTPARMW
jgi:glycosyltransferase involved in cell wall biosynthesis